MSARKEVIKTIEAAAKMIVDKLSDLGLLTFDHFEGSHRVRTEEDLRKSLEGHLCYEIAFTLGNEYTDSPLYHLEDEF